MIKLTRRDALKAGASAIALPLAGLASPTILRAQDTNWRHGMSLLGDLKYPAGFKHFDYVNPQAPKAGKVRLSAQGSFDNLNPFTYKGDAAGLVGSTIDTLFASALDEPGTMYGLIASHATYPKDYSSVTFKLDPRARFHDGSPVTPEDVIWSMQAVRSSHPGYSAYYKNIARAEKTGDGEVTFYFDIKGNRELPHITAQLNILPKHWWEAKNAKGQPRDIKKTTLKPLLGNGAYKIGKFKPGEWIEIERVEDYWAKDLPVNIGQNNFSAIRELYFRDGVVAIEGFKGDQYDWRDENSSKMWATAYDIKAVKKGRIVREEIPVKNSQGMQSFTLNLRRKELFGDPRVRRALNFAFDFEWSNTNLFYGQYKRTDSYFSNSELASHGLPGPDELKILEPLRGKIPDEVFTTEYINPVSGDARSRRNNLRQAAKLLREAGWKTNKDRVLENAAGKEFRFEILLVSPAFERIVLPYVEQLSLLGIKAKVKTIDSPQYSRRLEAFDFDCIVGNWGQSLSPGNEQRNFWSTKAADRKGSRNFAGIKDEAVDILVERLILSDNRKDLVAATRALDRVLLANHFMVPMWHISYLRTARWNRFGRPEKLPEYTHGFPTIWWHDEELAAKTKALK